MMGRTTLTEALLGCTAAFVALTMRMWDPFAADDLRLNARK